MSATTARRSLGPGPWPRHRLTGDEGHLVGDSHGFLKKFLELIVHRAAVLTVRIHLPPADSLSLSRKCLRRSRTPAFRAGQRGWLGDRVGRDAQGFPIRASRR